MSIRIQLKGPGSKRHVLSGLDAALPYAEFQALVTSKTGMPPALQHLSVGFPPKHIVVDDPKVPISDCIQNGDTVLLRQREDQESKSSSVIQGGDWEYPPSIAKGGRMERQEMPRDNSCLFHSILHVCGDTDKNSHSISSVGELRELISNIVASNPSKYDTVFLGSPNQGYQHHIRNPDTWGGAIELSILSIHYQVEIVAFDFHCLREDVFGEGQGYKKRVFLIYSGDHYDAMTYMLNAEENRRFSTKDTYAWERARHQAQFLHEAAAQQGKCARVDKWRREIGGKQSPAAAFVASGGRLDGKDEWSCPTCTFVNRGNATTTCSACSSSSHATPPTAAAPIPSPSSGSSSGSSSTGSSSSPTGAAASDAAISAADAAAIAAAMHEMPAAGQATTTAGAPWQCMSCTFNNAGSRPRCEMCDSPHPSRPAGPVIPADPQERPPAAETAPEALLGPSASYYEDDVPPVESPWTCSHCTFVNPRQTATCQTCDGPNPAFPSPQAPHPPGSDTIQGFNDFMRGFSAPAPPVQRWPCPNCQTMNVPNLMCCKECRRPNPYLQSQQADQCTLQ